MRLEFVGDGEGRAQLIFEVNVGGNVSAKAGELRDCVEGCGEAADIGISDGPEEDGGRTGDVFMERPTRCREGALDPESKANGKVSAAIGYSLGSKVFIDWSK